MGLPIGGQKVVQSEHPLAKCTSEKFQDLKNSPKKHGKPNPSSASSPETEEVSFFLHLAFPSNHKFHKSPSYITKEREHQGCSFGFGSRKRTEHRASGLKSVGTVHTI